MPDFFATEDDYARMVQAVGPKLAKKYMDADRKRGGMNIVPAEVEFKPVNGGLGVGGSNVSENDTIGSGALSAGSSEGDGSTDVAGLDLGGIPVAALGSIRKKMSAYSTLADEQKAFYDQLEQELLTRRIGPSKGEQLLQMSAALLQPTETRGFGASLANLVPVLQQQAQARREGLTSRADALQKLRMAQLAGKKDLLGQELSTDLALARIAASAGKLPAVVSGPNGPLEPLTGQPVNKPTPEAYTALEANPTEENLNSFIETFPRFRKELIAAYQRGLAKKGTVK